MQFFYTQLVASSLLLMSLGSAEHKWLDTSEYYGYRGPQAPLASDGRVIDTPEVAHARAAHLATHAEVVARVGHDSHQVWEEPDDNAENKYEERSYEPVHHYKGPLAPLGHDGRVIDTEEVAKAKAAHLEAHAEAAAKASPDYDYHGLHNEVWEGRSDNNIYVESHEPSHVQYHHLPPAYRGPPAPLAPDGRVVDTPEVAHAREAHLRAHAHAAALVSHRQADHYF